ncbi:AlwI family type II restriction endonuclease [Streptococcus sp. ZY19097]|uniref:AlwI family type II restriction endonuclease n=1 Tax=Streptococcus sp. ZY19097 TaxID=3231906 RepID=UPI00345B3037
MKVAEDSKFNMWNTNGRRKDITDAYTKYLTILNEEFESGNYEWDSFPKSVGQFVFYMLAIQSSPEIFKDTNKLDSFNKYLEKSEYANSFWALDEETFESLPKGQILLEDLDKNLEARARHYTSNLTKIGFAYNNRKISTVGKSYLNEKVGQLDTFEKLLPINSINLILLRQLSKLRVYSKDGSMYYSPFNLLLYTLLKYNRISDSVLFKMIELLNPKFPVNPDTFLDRVLTTTFEEVQLSYNNRISGNDEFPDFQGVMQYEDFSKYFTSQKDSTQSQIYYEFYLKNYRFVQNKTQKSLDILIELLKNKSKGKVIKTAFGGKESVYNTRKTRIEEFLTENADKVYLTDGTNNAMYYSEFRFSKRNSDVREYNRNFRKVALATGILHVNNGIAELAYRNLWEKFLNLDVLQNNIFVPSTKEDMEFYENSYGSVFYNNITLSKIYGYDENQVVSIVREITNELSLSTADEVKGHLQSQISIEFKEFVHRTFPKDKIIEILPLFSDRSNDKIIQKMVGVESSVPTIYEYIVGLAWYYLSDKDYDLHSSFNLTMTADFLPEKFAGGGYGDIVAVYDDEIVQLEVTLMDRNTQKRGEWEPVLRHAANLTIDEEPKPVTTLFVADELDDNTINIWRAVASVPLKSSREVQTFGKTAENVKIMPLKNIELRDLLSNNVNSTLLLTNIDTSFSSLSQEFDVNWRKTILDF